MSRPPFPPFTPESAAQKVRMAEDAWNTRDLGVASVPRILRHAHFLRGGLGSEGWERGSAHRLMLARLTARPGQAPGEEATARADRGAMPPAAPREASGRHGLGYLGYFA